MNTNDNIVVDWKHMSASQLNASLYNDWGQSDQTAQCLAIDGGGSTGSTGSAWGGAWVVGSGQSEGDGVRRHQQQGPVRRSVQPRTRPVVCLHARTERDDGRLDMGLPDHRARHLGLRLLLVAGHGQRDHRGREHRGALKTCKDGYLFEFNAVTGNLIWAWDPPSGTETPGSSRCPLGFPFNPTNSSMMDADFPTAVTNCAPTWTITCMRGSQPPYLQWPPELAGFESEQAIDTATGIVYATGHVVPSYVGYFGLNASTYFSSTGMGGVPCPTCGTLYNNATTWAINYNTGALVWHYPTATLQGYRGQTVVSGNVVYTVLSSGDIKMINAATGSLLRDYYIGAPMAQGISVGAAVNGQEYLIFPAGSCSPEAVATCPGTTPGDIIALTLVNVPPASATTTTVTTTSTTTSVTTTTLPGQTIHDHHNLAGRTGSHYHHHRDSDHSYPIRIRGYDNYYDYNYNNNIRRRSQLNRTVWSRGSRRDLHHRNGLSCHERQEARLLVLGARTSQPPDNRGLSCQVAGSPPPSFSRFSSSILSVSSQASDMRKN